MPLYVVFATRIEPGPKHQRPSWAVAVYENELSACAHSLWAADFVRRAAERARTKNIDLFPAFVEQAAEETADGEYSTVIGKDADPYHSEHLIFKVRPFELLSTVPRKG